MRWLALGLVGLAAGFVNTLAGSGSLLSLPMLMYLGLSPEVANGTNRVGVLLQNLVAVHGFRRQGALHLRSAAAPTITAVVGSLVGAGIAVQLDGDLLKKVLAALMLAMVGVMLLRPERWVEERPEALRRFGPWQGLVFFAVGVYGGFIQAGVGIFLLAALVLGAGFELVRANGVKNWIVGWLTLFALVVFVRAGQVEWVSGLVLGAGSMLGAWLATRLAVKRGARFVHAFVIAVVLLSAADMLGFFRWILRLS
ncbi:MAG: sulfite exporter TauE/SafE family protein [Candidatus Eremiobacterota bacterium]